jgi:hypothetical protein
MGGMNTNLTHIAFILDRSSSMESMRAEAIGGFNAFLKEQQDNEGEANLSVILFDHEYSPLVCGVPIAEMQPLTEKDYEPRGMTSWATKRVMSLPLHSKDPYGRPVWGQKEVI